MTDESDLGEQLEEINVHLVVADLEHAVNEWLTASGSISQVLTRLGALRAEFELLTLMLQKPHLELSVRVTPVS